MTAIERMKARAPDVGDDLCEALLEDARDMILAYTGRAELPPGLMAAQVQLALTLYNRMGIEGETAHSEGDVRAQMEGALRETEPLLRPWRLARIVNTQTGRGEGGRYA